MDVIVPISVSFGSKTLIHLRIGSKGNDGYGSCFCSNSFDENRSFSTSDEKAKNLNMHIWTTLRAKGSGVRAKSRFALREWTR